MRILSIFTNKPFAYAYFLQFLKENSLKAFTKCNVCDTIIMNKYASREKKEFI